MLEDGLAVGTDELKNMPQIRVYPNPASDVLLIGLREMQGEISVRLFSFSGVKLRLQNLRNLTEKMDVSGRMAFIFWSSGMLRVGSVQITVSKILINAMRVIPAQMNALHF